MNHQYFWCYVFDVTYVTWRICDMTHHSSMFMTRYFWRGSFMHTTRPICMCPMTHSYQGPPLENPWRFRQGIMGRCHDVYDMTLSCIWYDLFIWVPWLIYTRGSPWENQWCGLWGGVVMNRTWLCYIYDMTSLYVCRDSFVPGVLRGRMGESVMFRTVDYAVVRDE